jgi:hypothetical protein
LLDKYEHLSIDLVLRDAVSDLVEEGLDLEVRVGWVADSALISRRIGSTMAFLVAAPQLPSEQCDGGLSGSTGRTLLRDRKNGLITINVNGTAHNIDVEADIPLLWVLRDVLGTREPSLVAGRRHAGHAPCTWMYSDSVLRHACREHRRSRHYYIHATPALEPYVRPAGALFVAVASALV